MCFTKMGKYRIWSARRVKSKKKDKMLHTDIPDRKFLEEFKRAMEEQLEAQEWADMHREDGLEMAKAVLLEATERAAMATEDRQ